MLTVPNSWGTLREVNHCHGKAPGHPCDATSLPGLTIIKPGDVLRQTERRGTVRQEPGNHALIFEHGRIDLYDPPDLPQRHLAIGYVKVNDAERGKGWGKKLYAAAVSYAKSLGYAGIAASTYRSPDALRVWASLRRAGRVRKATRLGSEVEVYEG